MRFWDSAWVKGGGGLRGAAESGVPGGNGLPLAGWQPAVPGLGMRNATPENTELNSRFSEIALSE